MVSKFKLSGQNRQKSSLYECIFDNMALYFECRIKKNALLQTFGDFAHWESGFPHRGMGRKTENDQFPIIIPFRVIFFH